jgi:uncharacterized repeat protein (TIGR03803 family)
MFAGRRDVFGAVPPRVGSFSMPEPAASGYRVLYSFANTDGAYPQAGLLDVNGTFYGTTSIGGKGSEGTVFSITSGGKETTIHSFSSTGYDPLAGLINVNGTLYGTTNFGGKLGFGTVYAMSF